MPPQRNPHNFRFWTKPHFIAVDEPTNYLDVETVEALAKALQGVSRICSHVAGAGQGTGTQRDACNCSS